VIVLDHRVNEQNIHAPATDVKYRGSSARDQRVSVPCDEDGLAVLPVTSLGLRHSVSSERISTGIERLDTMLESPGVTKSVIARK